MFRIRRIRKLENLLQLKLIIGMPNTLTKYLIEDCECYGFYVNCELKGGYCIKHTALDDMRVIQQIPKAERSHLNHEDPFKYAELTISPLNVDMGLHLCLHIIRKLLTHKASFFVYSYLAEDAETEKMLRIGNPFRLYSGKACEQSLPLPVHVNVEMLSKFGIFRICVAQAIKKLRN